MPEKLDLQKNTKIKFYELFLLINNFVDLDKVN